MAHSYKSPPEMREGLSFEDWKKELSIWCAFTDLDKKRRGGAVFLTLSGKARETVLADVSLDRINSENGVKNITSALDKLYEQDKAESAYKAFDHFIKFQRPNSMSTKEYIIEFNLRLSKLKDYDMVLPDGVLAYYLLNCANLTEEQSSLCRATCKNLTYEEMKNQIDKVSISPGNSHSKTSLIEPQYIAQYSQDDQYLQDTYEQPNDNELDQDDEPEGAFYTRPGNQNYFKPRRQDNYQSKKKNPPDEYGNPSPCRYCKSIYHWVDKCPELPPGSRTNTQTRRNFPTRGKSGIPNHGQSAYRGPTSSRNQPFF